MPIPMTDLKEQYILMRPEVSSAIQRVIESGQFILGPEVEAFENEMATYCEAKFAVGVASGTDALILSLMACGIGPGDEVITTPFTFIATAAAVTHCGAVPVFADIDARTYNIDPSQIERYINTKTRAILPVHLFGQPAEMEDILTLAKKYNLKIIEDCAQALSAEYKGRKVGAFGDAGCFSFFPAKNLGAFGDGGLVTTNDERIVETVRILRAHGAKITYYHTRLGFTSRLDALQAAILRVKLKYLDNWSRMRRQIALAYSQKLSEIEGVKPPYMVENTTSSVNYYTIRLSDRGIDRNRLRQHLASKGIGTAIYYPVSLHLQEAYKKLGYKPGDFPESELAQNQVLSFPMFPEMSQEQVAEVVENVKEFLKK